MSDLVLLDDFLQGLQLEEGLSKHTLSAYRSDLLRFRDWLALRGAALTQFVTQDWQAYVDARLQQGWSPRSQARALASLRRWLSFLAEQGLALENPLSAQATPVLAQRLPRAPAESVVERLLDAPDVATPLGLRDRAMLELMYACGLRVSELVALRLDQLDLLQGWVRLYGKGNKERLLPMGDEARLWLERYLVQSRPLLAVQRQLEVVFVSQQGREMVRQTCWHRIKQLACQAGLSAELSPHALRHAFATHLLDHGADLRSVQLLLGHADLSTTQIYTHVAKQRLQSWHQIHHPRG